LTEKFCLTESWRTSIKTTQDGRQNAEKRGDFMPVSIIITMMVCITVIALALIGSASK
jgi:hypothetical protein